MSVSRVRPLRAAEFLVLSTLVLADAAGETDGEGKNVLPGQLLIQTVADRCKPCPVGQAIDDLTRLGCVEKPTKLDGKPMSGRIVVTQTGEAAMLEQRGSVLKRLDEEGKAEISKAQEPAEIKARKKLHGEVQQAVEAAVESIEKALQPAAPDDDPE